MADTFEPDQRTGRRRPGFGLGCLVGVLVTLLALIVLGAIVRRGPESFPGPIRAFFGANEIITTPAGGASLSLEQIRAIRGIQPTIQVMLTEADINSYLKEHPEEVGLPEGFRNPQVRFTEGRVRLLVSARVLIISTRVTIGMEPTVEDGELKLAVKNIEAGGVKLPGELRSVAEQRVAGLLAARLDEAGLEPESVTVGEGTLTVAARLVPGEE